MKKLILFLLLNNVIPFSLISQEYQNFEISPFSEKEITSLNIPTVALDTLSVELLNKFQLKKIPNDLTLKLLAVKLVDQHAELLPEMMTTQDSLNTYNLFFLGKKKYKIRHPVKSYFIVRTQSDDYPLSRRDYPDYHVQIFSLNFVGNELKSIILVGEKYLTDAYINTSLKIPHFKCKNIKYHINKIFYIHDSTEGLSYQQTLIIDKKGHVSVKN